jgi:hypothetical protein
MSDENTRAGWKISPALLLGQAAANAPPQPGTASAGVGLLCARASDGSIEVQHPIMPRQFTHFTHTGSLSVFEAKNTRPGQAHNR